QTFPLLEKEYPNAMFLFLNGPLEERLTPKGQYPSFYGCFDWHSAVHSHWQILRGMRFIPEWAGHEKAVALLDCHFSQENLSGERAGFQKSPRFGLPYGQAWLLALCAELRVSPLVGAPKWLKNIAQLEAHAVQQFRQLCETYTYAVRSGTHDQTAFSLGLVYDWAEIAGDLETKEMIARTGVRLFGEDHSAPILYEPSATDFLSPTLGEADLMARLLPQEQYIDWLEAFLPHDKLEAYRAVDVVDFSHGHLAHFAGLNLSRAWMLRHIAGRLPVDHSYRPTLLKIAKDHQKHGLPMAFHTDYMVSHWVPTFAVYLLTQTDDA
ncbi:MAG: DUF2891 family protein, partial [Chloroflexota bacterium]